MTDPAREMLRHAVATLAYRGTKAPRGAPEGFGTYRPSPTSRTPAEILAHICDLLDWALTSASTLSIARMRVVLLPSAVIFVTSVTGIQSRNCFTLALKWRFFGEKEGLQSAIKPYVTIPTGDEEKGHGYGREADGIRLISTFEREAWCVNVNLGYLYNEYGLQSNRDAYRPDIWYAGLSGQLRVLQKLWLVGETAVGRNPDVTSDTPPAYILGGFIYEITRNIDLDVGYKHGLNRPATDYSITGAITVGF